MDLETENRIAAILMKEAAELRRQAEKDGVSVYLNQPKPKVRPNSRFLTATVRGVQQANRAVEINEMWRVRQKELELDDRLKDRSKDQRSNGARYNNGGGFKSNRHTAVNDGANASCSSSKSSYSRNDDGLKDEELEEFLHSRAKRGRGAVGPRMDETGPYLPRGPNPKEELLTSIEHRNVVYGPKKPYSLESCESSETDTESSETDTDDNKREKKRRKTHSRNSKKPHKDKHKSKKKSKDKKKKRKEEKRRKRDH
ncbi:hypothetical protein F8388_016204 [Cannabis sativa]|uniref:Uncharacterized protein n=1 Tax=Cannabis sativa TaxID=3483 RepID=A0A7J6E7V7_CANSA|nr:hypothetical protein F8388_027315 [Cannabis sativa]KAF4370467.1 hypothetical protein F8388_016204 [Cannabis sativa]